MKPKRAGEILQFIKQRYWYDSITWVDDVTTNKPWSLKVLQEIEKRDLMFQFVANATWNKIESTLLTRLRDAGCRVLDLGDIPTSFFADPQRIIPFQTAIRGIRTKNLFPTYTVLLDDNTTIANGLETVKWGRTLNIVAPCNIQRPYRDRPPEEVLEMCRGLFNPTKLSYLELLGIQKTIETGRVDLLEDTFLKTEELATWPILPENGMCYLSAA